MSNLISQIKKEVSDGINDTGWRPLRTILKFGLWITLIVLSIFFVGYAFVYNYVYDFVISLARNFYWLASAASVLASIAAIISSGAILFALLKTFLMKGDTKSYSILGTIIALVFIGAYLDKHKFFKPGDEKKEMCAALLPGDAPTIKILGEGLKEGLHCEELTTRDAALALAIDRSRIPKEIVITSNEQLENLDLSSNGAQAIYMGKVKEDGTFRIYDGPGFDPKTLGILHPLTEEALENLKSKLKLKEKEASERKVLLDEIKTKAEQAVSMAKEEKRAREEAEKNLVAAERRAQVSQMNLENETRDRITAQKEVEKLKKENEGLLSKIAGIFGWIALVVAVLVVLKGLAG